MEALEITIEERTELGTRAGERMRKAGRIPAVVYSGGKPARLVSVDLTDYRKTIRGNGPTQLFKFKSKEQALSGKLALVKEVQVEPIKDTVLHLDFLALEEGHRITIAVPVKLVGESPSVKAGEAVLNFSLHELEIECLPTEIPRSLPIDISTLTIGHSLHAGDVPLPAGAKLKSDKSLAIVGVAHKKEEVLETKPAEAAAPVEGAAAAPAAGEKAAEGGAEKAGDKGGKGGDKGGKS